MPVPQSSASETDEATVPTAHFAVDPNPVAVGADGTPLSTLNCIVINPRDGRDMEPHPDPWRNNGCCARAGLDGPNLRCPNCHAEVATVRDDCWSVVELRFEPAAVLLVGSAER